MTQLFTADDLLEYDGETSLQIGIGFAGKVYDVSSRQDLYGEGGGYKKFAGRITTRSFAKVSLE